MQLGHAATGAYPFDRDRKRRHEAAAAGLGGRPDQRPAAPPATQINLTVMSGEELERHLTAFFGRRGYTVWPTPARGEVGAALLLCREDQGVVVQVKRWNAALGQEVVQATIAAIRFHAATLHRLGCTRLGGLVVATCAFKPEARELAHQTGILLWDREALEIQLKAEAAALQPPPIR